MSAEPSLAPRSLGHAPGARRAHADADAHRSEEEPEYGVAPTARTAAIDFLKRSNSQPTDVVLVGLHQGLPGVRPDGKSWVTWILEAKRNGARLAQGVEIRGKSLLQIVCDPGFDPPAPQARPQPTRSPGEPPPQAPELAKEPEVEVENSLREQRAPLGGAVPPLHPEGVAPARTVGHPGAAPHAAVPALGKAVPPALAAPPLQTTHVAEGGAHEGEPPLEPEPAPAPSPAANDASSQLLGQFTQGSHDKITELDKVGRDFARHTAAASRKAQQAIDEAVVGALARVTTAAANSRATTAVRYAGTCATMIQRRDAAINKVKSDASTERTQLDKAAGDAGHALDDAANSAVERLDRVYALAVQELREAGVRAGNTALKLGEQKAQHYLSAPRGPSTIMSGDMDGARANARADAAHKVAFAYKDSMRKAGEDYSQDYARGQGKQNDLRAVREFVEQQRLKLKEQKAASFQKIARAESSLTQTAHEKCDEEINAFGAEYQAIQHEIDAREKAEKEGIQQQAKQLKSTVRHQTRAAQAKVLEGVRATSATLRQQIDQIGADPNAKSSDPEELQGMIGKAQASLEEGVSAGSASLKAQARHIHADLDHRVAKFLQGLAKVTDQGGGDQGLTAQRFNAIADGARDVARDVMVRVEKSSTSAMKEAANVEQVKEFGKTTADALNNNIDQVDRGAKSLVEQFENGPGGLQQIVQHGHGQTRSLAAETELQAAEAAKQVQPRWKSVLKWVVAIAVLVVVAVVAGPAVIGFVAGMAGAMGMGAVGAGIVGAVVGGAVLGAASGAVLEMGNQIIDGIGTAEGIHFDFKRIGTSALAGAIGGALGGAGGALVQGVVRGVGMRIAADLVINTGSGAIADLATGNFSFEGVLSAGGIGFAMSLAQAFISSKTHTRVRVGEAGAPEGRIGGAARRIGEIQEGFMKRGQAFGERMVTPRPAIEVPTAPRVAAPEVGPEQPVPHPGEQPASEHALGPAATEEHAPPAGERQGEAGVPAAPQEGERIPQGAAAGEDTPGVGEAVQQALPEPVLDGEQVAKGRNVGIGQPIDDQRVAESIMRKIMTGDSTGFDELGVSRPPEGFDPTQIEWGLGQLPDGRFILIRGESGAVDWGGFPGVKALAHSHPLTAQKLLTRNNIRFSELPRGNYNDVVNVFPSAADVRYCAQFGISEHTVRTPYAHKGDGVIGNPTGGAREARVEITIHDPELAGNFAGSDIPVYRSRMVARAGSEIIWQGEVFSCDHPAAGSMIIFEAPPLTKVAPRTTGQSPAQP